MEIEQNKECYGCQACANMCPKQAIKMTEDKYGFFKPVINKDLCIECGLCDKICPSFSFDNKNLYSPKVFAILNNNDDVRLKSTSGGVFPLFAKYFIENNGVVFGAVYDADMKVLHTSARNYNEIEKMQTSKYVQSDINYTYKEAGNYLENGELVLFTGTPCQIAGLKNYLKKYYDNLLTMDLVCYGVPSRKVFELYKQEFLNSHKDSGKILNINFRSKREGWIRYNNIDIYTDTKKYEYSAKKDSFIKSFNLSLNNTCYECKFRKIPRVGDISVGDFWGVDEYDSTLNDKKGTSIVLINSEKAFKYFELIKQECFNKEIPLDAATKYNDKIVSTAKTPKNRDKFFESINRGVSLARSAEKYFSNYPKIVRLLYKLLPKFIKNKVKRG